MDLDLVIIDVNGAQLTALGKVSAQVYTMTGPIQSLESTRSHHDVGRALLNYDLTDAGKIRVVLSGPGYPTVDFAIIKSGQDGEWAVEMAGVSEVDKESKRVLSKAYVRFRTKIGPITEVTVVMPRLWLAPFGPTVFTGAPHAKPGTLIKRHEGVVGLAGTYLDLQRSSDTNFRSVEEEMLKAPADPKATDWGRLNAKAVPINRDDLWLRLAEFGGGGGGPRFLVALCGPVKGMAAADGGVDVVLFYLPSTIVQDAKHTFNLYPRSKYPFRDDYPYAESVLEQPGSWSQTYCSAAFTYFMQDGQRGGFRLAHQMLAAKKAAIIVMPICPYGDLGPFLSRAGAWRLVREATYLAYGLRETDEPPMEPTTRRLVVCGYSSGFDFANNLLIPDKNTLEDKNGRGYDRSLWGAKADDLAKAWKETWVLDARGGIPPTVKYSLARWVREGDDRRLRIYQTQYTVGTTWSPAAELRAKDDFALLFGATPVVNTMKGDKGEILAEEAHGADGRCSAVYFSNAFMNFAASSDAKIVDAHHTIPNFAFGHAARISGLRPTS